MSPHRTESQWGWSEVEELLQCPVCLEAPSPNTNVEQCRNGHHICSTCRIQVNHCPICKCNFYGTRNFVVEELVNHYEVLKNLLLLTALDNVSCEKKKRKPKNSNVISIRDLLPEKRKVADTAPKPSKGKFQCRVQDCDAVLSCARLLNHVRSAHRNTLIQGEICDDGKYSTTLEFAYPIRDFIRQNSFVLCIRGVGLLFVNIDVLKSGELLVFLQMGLTYTETIKYITCLEFKNLHNTVSYNYNQKLVSVRENIRGIIQKKIAYTLDSNSCNRISSSGKIKCVLNVKPFCESTDRCLLTTVNAFNLNLVAALRESLIEQKVQQNINKNATGTIKKILPNNKNPTIGVSTKIVSPLESKQPTEKTSLSNNLSNTGKSSKKHKKKIK